MEVWDSQGRRGAGRQDGNQEFQHWVCPRATMEGTYYLDVICKHGSYFRINSFCLELPNKVRGGTQGCYVLKESLS